ncbi:SDR family oxidoreductase [Alloacidobacterium dinghuense]|uniref:SDR family oxidoreductase n=1 Tax=Alloacidobacterium dinghuense TaxID=2763107 RepID=UPI0020369946|nr:SDR family oxidoreductase [Alloacidobacterium dinghuense]
MASKRQQLPSRVLVLGATSAIANGVMRPLAEQGARFYLVARSPEKLKAVASDLETRGASAIFTCVMDLDDTASHEAMLAEAAEKLDTIDLALLAHGVLGDQERAQTDYATAEAILRTNFLSAVSLITWLANYFEATHQGTLAVISSVAGDRGRKSNYVYGTSKGALNIFLDGVRNRIDRSGVHVLTIKPGFVSTPMTAHLPQTGLFAHPAAVGRWILKAIEKRKDVAYVPPIWAVIMLIIRSIPNSIFKKLNL